jgi:hypothetical protein
MSLSDEQVTELAQGLKEVIKRVYQDPEFIKEFNKWQESQMQ